MPRPDRACDGHGPPMRYCSAARTTRAAAWSPRSPALRRATLRAQEEVDAQPGFWFSHDGGVMILVRRRSPAQAAPEILGRRHGLGSAEAEGAHDYIGPKWAPVAESVVRTSMLTPRKVLCGQDDARGHGADK